MSCFSPLYATRRLQLDSDGTPKTKMTFSRELSHENAYKMMLQGDEYFHLQKIACGCCLGCRLDHAREWATRLVLEGSMYSDDHNWFLTLTYNDEHLHKVSDILPSLDEFDDFIADASIFNEDRFHEISDLDDYTLFPLDVQAFVKRLRRRYEYKYNHKGIRIFYCGEYGEKYGRPHYHLIVFNCPIEDLVHIGSNFQGDRYYSSDLINSLWLDKNKQPLGFIQIGEFNRATACYTARYVVKKQKDDFEIPERSFAVRPFLRSSRNPGIGASYLEDYDNIEKMLRFGYIQLKDGVQAPIPGYFMDYLKKIDPAAVYRLLEQKSIRSLERDMDRRFRTNYTEDEYLSICEHRTTEAYKKCKRDFC